MFATLRKAEYLELVALFFVNALAMGMWFVPLAAVLDAHGLAHIKAYAFATSALAALVSPLIFGALADRHAPPVVVLRWLALATAATMALASTAIQQGWKAGLVLAFIQLHSLCTAPTFSISTTIVLARLREAKREFGPVRAMATFGWMAGCWLVSALNADDSTRAGFAGALAWLGLAAFTYLLPSVAPPKTAGRVTWRQRMGWDALTLLRHRDHRVVFITAALFSIPTAALFPFTPSHLRELGFARTTAWMSLAQVTEIIAMFALAGVLARWRLKWAIGLGLGLGLVRHVFCALDNQAGLLVGIFLHGGAFTLVLISSQIYLEERIDAAWRARAQALFAMMTVGVGNLLGYLGTGWWFNACTAEADTRWPVFWGGLAAVMGMVLGYFLVAYQGLGHGLRRPKLGEADLHSGASEDDEAAV